MPYETILMPNVDYETLAKRVFDLSILEGRKDSEISEILKKEGFNLTAEQVEDYRTKIYKLLQPAAADEKLRQYALDSMEKIKEDFELARDEIRTMIGEVKGGEKIAAIRTLKELIELAIRRLEGFKDTVTQINMKSYYTIQQVGEIVNTGKEELFKEMEAEYDMDNNVIILRRPTQEAIEVCRKWKSAAR